jgi:hypothetical protein
MYSVLELLNRYAGHCTASWPLLHVIDIAARRACGSFAIYKEARAIIDPN